MAKVKPVDPKKMTKRRTKKMTRRRTKKMTIIRNINIIVSTRTIRMAIIRNINIIKMTSEQVRTQLGKFLLLIAFWPSFVPVCSLRRSGITPL